MEARKNKRMPIERVREIVDGWKRSGLKQADYARQVNMPLERLRWYTVRAGKNRDKKPAAFKQLQMTPVAPATDNDLKIRWRDCSVELGNNFSKEALGQIVTALRSSL